MKPKLLLRIASLLMFLHTIGHTFGALSWKDAPDDAVGRVITGMQTTHFQFMGRSVSMGLFYEGYGLSMILVLLLISLMLWFLSGETKSRLSVRLMQSVAVFLLLMSVIEYKYFFAFAASFSFLAGLCTLIAVFSGNVSGEFGEVVREK